MLNVFFSLYQLLKFLKGILISNHGSGGGEPCRVAPYVVPANIRTPTTTTSSSLASTTSSSTTNTSSFSAFDPALITAAHQVK